VKSNRRILFCLKFRDSPYGNGYPNSNSDWGDGKGPFLSSGLYNSANFVCEELRRKGYETRLVHVVDNNAIHKEIVAFNATDVIIEAYWVVPGKFEVLRKACPHVNFTIRNHSETPFLANEGSAFAWSLDYMQHARVNLSCNSTRMLREMRVLVKEVYPKIDVKERVPYLPNFYPLREAKQVEPNLYKNTLDIGCFGAVRPLKNHMMQAIAAIEFARKQGKHLRFHINAGRVEMNGSPILKNIRELFERTTFCNLVEVPWKPHKEFKHYVSKMDFVMQVSFSETFNIVAADAISQGVPTVTSKEVVWASKVFQADPTCSKSIVEALERADIARTRFGSFNLNLRGLEKYNRESIKLWEEYFN
jgi:hypothetical protein